MNSDKATELSATSPAQFPALLHALHARGSETFVVERFQLIHLLRALFANNRLQFPLRVRHDSKLTPDIQLDLGAKRIALEETRIALRNLEKARLLQQTRGLGVLASTEFYVDEEEESDGAVLNRGFAIPALSRSPSLEDSQSLWLKCFQQRLEKKNNQRKKAHFQHGDEDWLVLWDKVSLDWWPHEARAEALMKVLDSYWGQDWFKRVFVQHEYFEWLIECSAEGSAVYPQ